MKSTMKSTTEIKGGGNVKSEALLASLMNEPWLIEEAWLETVISMLHENDLSAMQAKTLTPADKSYSANTNGGIANISVHGPIFSRPNFITEFFGIGCVSSEIQENIEAALNDEDIESIILDIDSPGGAVTGTNQLASVISEGREVKNITAYVGGSGASAAYWLASGASEIILDATARVGSIGVVAAYPTPQEDEGYVEIVNTASPNKRPDVRTDKGKKVVTEELDALADVFINTVAKNRNVSAATVKNDFGKGGMLVGQNAIDAGMADRLGSLEGLINEKLNKGDDSMAKLTIESLKADHKDIYDTVIASVKFDTSDLDASIKEKDADIVSKDTEITELKEKLASSSDQNTALGDRVKSLEKKDTMRSEKDLKGVAGNVFTEKLAGSSIPERLYEKVRSQVDYNKYMAEGKLDMSAFTDAVEAEIKEWEDTFASDEFVQGVGVSTTVRQVAEGVNDEDVSDRMLSYLK